MYYTRIVAMNTTFPQVAVGAVVMKDNKVLLVKRKNPPAQGMWALPGGRVHAGESLEEAVEREIREETGIHVQVGPVVHVFDVIERNDDDLSVHYVIIDYRAEYMSGDLSAGDDALEVGWVSKDEIGERAVNDSTRLLLKQKFGFR